MTTATVRTSENPLNYAGRMIEDRPNAILKIARTFLWFPKNMFKHETQKGED
jgi:hypothetical protein